VCRMGFSPCGPREGQFPQESACGPLLARISAHDGSCHLGRYCRWSSDEGQDAGKPSPPIVYSLNRLFFSSLFSYPEYSRSASVLKPDEPENSPPTGYGLPTAASSPQIAPIFTDHVIASPAQQSELTTANRELTTVLLPTTFFSPQRTQHGLRPQSKELQPQETQKGTKRRSREGLCPGLSCVFWSDVGVSPEWKRT